VNATILSNFLQALTLTGAKKNLKRFILTYSFKQYTIVHISAAKQPLLESDPLLENSAAGALWPPIFYYEQQRILAAAAKKGG
jgi:hypothetical protein